jgi:hypothetical protein
MRLRRDEDPGYNNVLPAHISSGAALGECGEWWEGWGGDTDIQPDDLIRLLLYFKIRKAD